MNYNDELNQLLGYMRKLSPVSTFYRPMHYILDHIPSLAAMSIYDLADQCYVSTSTISRLCKELGFKNYQEFKIRTYACYRRLADSDELLYPAYMGGNQQEDDKLVAGALNYLDYCQQALNLFSAFAHSERFLAHMKLLREASVVVLYAPRERNINTFIRRLILRGKAVRIFFGEIDEIISWCDTDLTDWENACTLTLIYQEAEYKGLLPLYEKQHEQGTASILICPDAIPVQESLHDLIFMFPEVEVQRDELFYELYLNCIMNAY